MNLVVVNMSCDVLRTETIAFEELLESHEARILLDVVLVIAVLSCR